MLSDSESEEPILSYMYVTKTTLSDEISANKRPQQNACRFETSFITSKGTIFRMLCQALSFVN